MVMTWSLPNHIACSRSRPAGVPSCGRQWSGASRDGLTFQRRSEIAGLAFALLGGRVAARDFLSSPGPDHARTMLETATASAIGQIQITHLLWKIAAHRMRPYQ
jgi:hypothetical protein